MTKTHNRYLVLEVYPKDYLEQSLERLNEVFRLLSGKDALGVNIRIYNKYHEKGLAIIGVPRNLLNTLRASICLVREINNIKVALITVKATGTLRKARAIAQSTQVLINH